MSSADVIDAYDRTIDAVAQLGNVDEVKKPGSAASGFSREVGNNFC